VKSPDGMRVAQQWSGVKGVETVPEPVCGSALFDVSSSNLQNSIYKIKLFYNYLFIKTGSVSFDLLRRCATGMTLAFDSPVSPGGR